MPSVSVFEVNDPSTGASMKMKETNTYIAISEDDKWYLFDISKSDERAIFVEAYPA